MPKQDLTNEDVIREASDNAVQRVRDAALDAGVVVNRMRDVGSDPGAWLQVQKMLVELHELMLALQL